jgi:hypothetical protein
MIANFILTIFFLNLKLFLIYMFLYSRTYNYIAFFSICCYSLFIIINNALILQIKTYYLVEASL